MKKISLHTPIPWELKEMIITDKEGINFHTWFISDGKTVPLSKANAEFIVRAVNSYSILLEAAKKALSYLNEGEDSSSNAIRMELIKAIAQSEKS